MPGQMRNPASPRKARAYIGHLRAAIRPGTSFKHLRVLLKAAEEEKLDWRDLWNQASLSRQGVTIPSLETVLTEEGTI